METLLEPTSESTITTGLDDKQLDDERLFTEYARMAVEGREPSAEDLDRVWSRLRHWTCRALQRRGMWSRRPIFLGIVGMGAWVTPETVDRAGTPRSGRSDALDELVQDVYVEIFVKRLRTLARYVRRGRTVEAVVRRAVDQALHERQSARDPLGHRLYQWLRSAARSGVESGALRLLDGGPRIGSTTVLGIGDPEPSEVPAEAEDLELEARRWNDLLFVDWLTARGRDAEQVVEDLARLLAELPERGIRVVRFRALVTAMTRDTRARLAVLFADWQPAADAWIGGEAGADVAWVDPRTALDARDRFRALAGCVEQRIDGVDAQQRTRLQMRRLWRLLGVWARSMATGPGTDAPPRWSDLFESDAFPSARELGRILHLRHERIQDLMDRLKREIGPCLESTGAGSTGTGSLGAADPARVGSPSTSFVAETAMASTDDLNDRLRAQTLDAAAGLRRADGVGSLGSNDAAPGRLYLLGEDLLGEDLPADDADGWVEAEWLVLEADGDRRLLVPADGEPWRGSKDAPLAAEVFDAEGFEELTARLDLGFWAPAASLPPADSEIVPETVLADLVRARARVLAGELDDVSADAWETDVDPDYRAWRRRLTAERDRLVKRLGGRLGEEPEGESETRTETEDAPQAPRPLEADDEYAVVTSFPVSPFPVEPTAERRPDRLRSLALAASLVLAVTLGLVAGRVLEQADPSLVEVRERLEKENRELTERLEAERLAAEQALSDARTEAETERLKEKEAYESRLRSLEETLGQEDRVEVVGSWVYVPPGIQRSGSDEVIEAGDRSVMILVPARDGDRIEVRALSDGRLVHAVTAEGLDLGDNLGLRIPGRLLPPGRYRVEVTRGDERVTVHSFVVAEKAPEDDLWP